eukprot:gene3887-15196_t
MLKKIQIDQAEGIRVLPNWPTQPWYSKPQIDEIKANFTEAKSLIASAAFEPFCDSSPLQQPSSRGDNPTICRFFKGVFELRPALPKYNAIWDESAEYAEEISNPVKANVNEEKKSITNIVEVKRKRRRFEKRRHKTLVLEALQDRRTFERTRWQCKNSKGKGANRGKGNQIFIRPLRHLILIEIKSKQSTNTKADIPFGSTPAQKGSYGSATAAASGPLASRPRRNAAIVGELLRQNML